MRIIVASLFLMFAFAPRSSFCQHLVSALGIENTVAGSQYGASLSYQAKSLFSVGAFYQAGLPKKTNDTHSNKNFTGVVVNMPVVKSQNINFYVQSRFGFVDERFFVFTPGIDTEIHLVGNVWIHFGGGIRFTYPSLMTKISFKI